VRMDDLGECRRSIVEYPALENDVEVLERHVCEVRTLQGGEAGEVRAHRSRLQPEAGEVVLDVARPHLAHARRATACTP